MIVNTIDRVVKVVKELACSIECCPGLASSDFTKVSVSSGPRAKVMVVATTSICGGMYSSPEFL